MPIEQIAKGLIPTAPVAAEPSGASAFEVVSVSAVVVIVRCQPALKPAPRKVRTAQTAMPIVNASAEPRALSRSVPFVEARGEEVAVSAADAINSGERVHIRTMTVHVMVGVLGEGSANILRNKDWVVNIHPANVIAS